MQPKTPKRLRIGCRVFDVKEMSDREAFVTQSLGVFLLDKSEIAIQSQDDFLLEAEVFWHEVFHALHYVAGIETEQEEHNTQQLTQGFLNLVTHNPCLLPYLEEFVHEMNRRMKEHDLGID